jgi:hypothetical protein
MQNNTNYKVNCSLTKQLKDLPMKKQLINLYEFHSAMPDHKRSANTIIMLKEVIVYMNGETSFDCVIDALESFMLDDLLINEDEKLIYHALHELVLNLEEYQINSNTINDFSLDRDVELRSV